MRRSQTGRTAAGTLAAAAVLAVAGCGSPQADPRGPGVVSPGTRCLSDMPRYGGEPTTPSTATAAPHPSGTPSPVPATEGTEKDGVRITGIYGGSPGAAGTGCDPSAAPAAEFEVTNHGAATMTYTITFTMQGYSNMERVVGPVGAGRTVRGTVPLDRTPGGVDGGTRVSILKVRSVPTDEAPSQGGPCPASGVRLYIDQGDAAMGLRVVGLHLENCGKTGYTLNSRPRLQILDADHRPVDEVRIVPPSEITVSDGPDGTDRPLTLAPGERAQAGLVWRNTVQGPDGGVDAPYVRVWAGPGAHPVMVTPELDLGTTGKLGIHAWQKER
ncbi:DUF4232 domain-containing protein [Streptomyces sp. NPDC047085]|uniref:DUF4232 domain-containing protein n=1 Tax=Streptomyces sp. NPDC047085 TaxID=3155140 RepID=UPI0033D69E86